MKKLITLSLLMALAIGSFAQCTINPTVVSYTTPMSPQGTYYKGYSGKVFFTVPPSAVNVAIYYADPARQNMQANSWCQGYVNGYWSYINCMPNGYLTLSPGFTSSISTDLIFVATDINGARICEIPFTMKLPAGESYCTALPINVQVMDSPDYTKNQFIVSWFCYTAQSYDISVTGPSGTVTTSGGSEGYKILTGDYSTTYSTVVTAHFADGKTLVSPPMSITTGAAPLAPGAKKKR